MSIFLSQSLNMCFRCSKEPSHRDGSFKYPQHMFGLRNEKIVFNFPSYLEARLMCRLIRVVTSYLCGKNHFHASWPIGTFSFDE